MPNPIAVQLYSVRELLADDFAGIVKKIAEMGYIGVEPFGLDVEKAKMQAKVFTDLGLQVPSIHGDLPLGENQNKVLDILKTVKSPRLFCNRGADQFKTVDTIKQFRDDLNAAADIAAEHGLIVGYHNHWSEFDLVEGTGKTGYALLQEGLDPAVELQVDTYWAQVGNHDPAALVKELGQRARVLHIKDGPAQNNTDDMLAVGEGVMDFPAIIAAGEGNVEWVIVELDHCATDMLEAVQKSYAYLVGEGLARGNK
jgi:sugar phosphate isomerase/epimerase